MGNVSVVVNNLLLFYVMLFILILIIHWFIAKEFYIIAIMKGFDERKYFWLPFLLGLIGYLMIIALPDRGSVDDTDDR